MSWLLHFSHSLQWKNIHFQRLTIILRELKNLLFASKYAITKWSTIFKYYFFVSIIWVLLFSKYVSIIIITYNLNIEVLNLIWHVSYTPCESSFISTQFLVLNLDGWFGVLSNKFIVCTPFSAGCEGGGWGVGLSLRPIFQKRGGWGLGRISIFKGGCWERGGWLFFRGGCSF